MLSQANVSKAMHYSKLAAEQAEAATAWAEAARHYDDCLTLIKTSDESLDEMRQRFRLPWAAACTTTLRPVPRGGLSAGQSRSTGSAATT